MTMMCIEKRRFALIDEAYKLKGDKCENCGETHRATFALHHKDPSQKLFTFSGNGWNQSREKILSELEKCQLLCQNCHFEIHSEMDSIINRSTD